MKSQEVPTTKRQMKTRPSRDLDALGQRRTWRPVVVAVTAVAVVLLMLAAMAGTSASRLQTDIAGTPCPDATPGSSGTPTPSVDATPAVVDIGLLCGEISGLNTPVAADELTVTVESDNLTAGPRDLTVAIVDATGQPVTDATVTIRTRSLEMDHGISDDETVQTEPGRYLAERVSLGMGGDWLAEITIERPGADPVIFYVVLTLDGPTHGH